MGGIVVQDEMDLLIGLPSNMEVQLVQEFQELSAAMPEVKLGIHRAGSHVQPVAFAPGNFARFLR